MRAVFAFEVAKRGDLYLNRTRVLKGIVMKAGYKRTFRCLIELEQSLLQFSSVIMNNTGGAIPTPLSAYCFDDKASVFSDCKIKQARLKFRSAIRAEA